jgi:two-component system, OmpR family, sensor histidine kinase KdpD
LVQYTFVKNCNMKGFLFRKIKKSHQFVYSVGIVVIVSAVCFSFYDYLGYRVAALLLLFTVSLVAVVFDILPVLLSAALSALIWDYFFIPPRFTIHVDTTEDLILLIMYFIIAMVHGVLTYKIRQVEKASNLREEKANSVKLYNTILNSLSHELRTPIAAIIGATDNLLTNTNISNENKEQLVAEISKAALRLNQQVENLLNISRLESGHIKPRADWCDISELIYDVVKRVEENNQQTNVQVSIQQDLPLCRLDKGMLEQVIYNLLNNAAFHNKPGTRIEISTCCYGDRLEINIDDDGMGIRNVDIKDVFDKFSRERRKTNTGSGLGLSIVKGFTEALGGHVELKQSPNQGAHFRINIPVSTNYLNIENNDQA